MNLSAVLLAGGESRRMGQDKATLLFRGRPLWQIQLNLLRKMQPDEIFVSARTDPKWRPSDVQFVPDEAPSRGPLSGLLATLQQIHTDLLLVLAIDLPFMTPEYLRSLCDQAGLSRGVVPMIGDRAEPLAAIYPKCSHLDLVAALSTEQFSLQSVIKKLLLADKLRLAKVSKDDERLFRNLNEPCDFI
jgi:molybdopterin-guanine dinucleotide biosynthesis protein A